MPFCKECGACLEDDAKYCTVCGTKRSDLTATDFAHSKANRLPETESYNFFPSSAGREQQPKGRNYDPTIYIRGNNMAIEPQRKKNKANIFVIFISLALIGSLVFYFSSTSASKASAEFPNSTSPLPSSTPEPIPVTIYNGTVLRSISYKGQCPFEVKAPSGSGGYYVFLKYQSPPSNSTEQRMVKESYTPPLRHDVVFYVSAGQSVEIDVPVGVYKFFYAYGETWYGEKLKFGDDTRYYSSDDLLEFYVEGDTAIGNTISLQKQTNGNFETDAIPESIFPQ